MTDAQLQGEVSTMVSQTGLLSHTQPGHTPLVMLLTPPGVVTCVDSAGNLCSANSAATARFCSYHSQVNVGGTEVSYVVQPWAAASVFTPTFCEDPDLQPIPNPVMVGKSSMPRNCADTTTGTTSLRRES